MLSVRKVLVCLWMIVPFFASEMKVLVFAGSTRAESYNKKLAQKAAELLRKRGAFVTFLDLKDYPMPFYDADLEEKEGMPKKAQAFRAALMAHEAVIIASPEYNASLSAVLKNALDWASRSPEGGVSDEAFAGKKFAIMSASPSRNGGARGLAHLRAVLEALGADVVEAELTLAQAYEKGAIERKEIAQNLQRELDQLLPAP